MFFILAAPAPAGWWSRAPEPPAYLSPATVIADAAGRRVFVAEYTGRRVDVVDLASNRVTRSYALALPPTGLALDEARGRLYVTEESPQGRVEAIDLATGRAAFALAAGHTPMAPVLAAGGRRLWVCNRFNDEVVLFDLEARAALRRAAVPREPVAAALTPDGRLLVVANHLPAMRADGAYVAAAVSLLDTAAGTVVTNLLLPNGSTGLRGVCLSPDGRYAYVTHTLGRYQLPTTQLDRGWMNTSAISVIDLAARALLTSFLLDDLYLGAANPWGVAVTADGRRLCVAHAGSHELSLIDRAALHGKLDQLAAGQRVSDSTATLADVPNDLSFLVGLRQRVRLGGNGPRGLALAGTTAVAAEYFTDSLAAVDLAGGEDRPAAREIPLGPANTLTQVRRGEMYFNDAQFCFQQWQSCTTCHPDSRADALNWDLLNDGIGNPKNTKNMLLAHRTPPAMSLGVRESTEAAVRAGLTHIQFAVRPEADAAAIDAYLTALQPVPSPRLQNGRLSPAARRGARVFERAGCNICHPAPLFTDMQKYDVGTGRDLDADKAMDTPTLVEAWRTAPYLHDGSAATLREALTTRNVNDQHGVLSTLAPGQVDDLLEYVMSL